MFEFFNQGWVGSLIGVVGIFLGIMGIFSYRISKSISKPSYQKSSLRLIGHEKGNLPNEVTVTYKGSTVERLTKTTLILWNNGSESLDGKDIVEADPLTLTFDEQDNILSYKIISRTKDVNNFTIKKDNIFLYKLYLDFDYLDPNDGVVIELLHDSDNRYPKVMGTIKGIPSGFVDHGKVVLKKQIAEKGLAGKVFEKHKIILVIGVFFGIGVTIFGLLPQDIRDLIVGFFPENKARKSFYQQPVIIIVGLLYTIMPSYILWAHRKKYPKQLETSEIEL